MSQDVMPAVEAARERFVQGCKDAWDTYSREYARTKRPKGLRAYLTALSPAYRANEARLQVVRDTLLSDMRQALPGLDIPSFEEAARRSRYWCLDSE